MHCNTSAMVLVISVAYFILATATASYAGDAAYVRCNRECIMERNTCSNDCRLREEQTNRVEIVLCLTECKDEYVECEAECSCVSRCSTERKNCISKCNTHPFQTRWNRRQCRMDCQYEGEVCQDLC